MSRVNSNAWINLQAGQILLLDDQPETLNILVQILLAFGVRQIRQTHKVEEAKAILDTKEFDLIITNANLKNSSAYDFLSWLRRANMTNAFAPAVLVTGHTQRANVERARDCGANVVVAKPVSPTTLLERILWITREKRPFVKCGQYVGPDRRFHDIGPPLGAAGRRQSDIMKAEAAAAEAEQAAQDAVTAAEAEQAAKEPS